MKRKVDYAPSQKAVIETTKYKPAFMQWKRMIERVLQKNFQSEEINLTSRK